MQQIFTSVAFCRKKPKHSKAQSNHGLSRTSREVGIVDWALLCFGFLWQHCWQSILCTSTLLNSTRIMCISDYCNSGSIPKRNHNFTKFSSFPGLFPDQCQIPDFSRFSRWLDILNHCRHAVVVVITLDRHGSCSHSSSNSRVTVIVARPVERGGKGESFPGPTTYGDWGLRHCSKILKSVPDAFFLTSNIHKIHF